MFKRTLRNSVARLAIALLPAASYGTVSFGIVSFGSSVFAAGEAATDTNQVPHAPPQVIVNAVALLNSSLTAETAEQRDAILAKAQTGLDTFLRTNPTHRDAPLVELQLGVVHVTAGKAAMNDARSVAEADRATLITKARERFTAAEKLFTTVIDQLGQRMKMNVGAPQDGNQHSTQERLALKGEFIRAQMFHAGVLEELAATYAPESRDARVNYQAAADRYEEIYKNYRTLISGLVARLKQGQCHQNLGDARRALGLYNDILSQPDEIRDLHRLRVSAMYLSLECWNSEQEKMHELAFTQGEEFLTKLPRNEELWPEWQAVRFHTAQGYLLAATTKKKDGNLSPDRAEWLSKAREHAQALADQSGPYKGAAEALLGNITKSEMASVRGGRFVPALELVVRK